MGITRRPVLVDVAVELVIVRHVCQSLGEAAHLAISAGNDQFTSLIYKSPELFVVHHGGQSLLVVLHAAPLLPNRLARLGGRLFIESVTVPFQGGLVLHAPVPLIHLDILAHAGERISSAILVGHIEARGEGVLHRLRGVVVAVEGERVELPQFGMAIEVTPIAVGEEFVPLK